MHGLVGKRVLQKMLPAASICAFLAFRSVLKAPITTCRVAHPHAVLLCDSSSSVGTRRGLQFRHKCTSHGSRGKDAVTRHCFVIFSMPSIANEGRHLWPRAGFGTVLAKWRHETRTLR